MNKLPRGKVIAFSGIDGSGKSTMCELVYQYYKNIIPSIMLSGFEERIFTGELERISLKMNCSTRDLFSDYIRNIAWMSDLSFTALERIVPLINSGTTVFVDRYQLCAKVYSLATTTQHITKLFPLYSCLPMPDVCIYLSIDPKVAVERIRKRGEIIAYYENEIGLLKIRNMYESIIPSEPYSVITIDAARPVADIFPEVVDIINKVLYS